MKRISVLTCRRLLFLVLLSATHLAHAAVYRWTDASGQVHFGDRPPAQADSREVPVNTAPIQNDSTARQRHHRMTEFLNQQQQEREARQAQEASARKQAERADRKSTRLNSS